MSNDLGSNQTEAAADTPGLVPDHAPHGLSANQTSPLAHPHAIPVDLIELLFFAYRDFVSDPDRILEQYGFGRAHHRVLHFVNRRAGLTIAALLDILQITKQSLNRVLKELIEQGYIESRAGDSDRRQRLLFPTPRGEKLALDLAMLQSKRITQALQDTGPHQRGVIEAYLLALINPADRADIDSHIHDVLHRTEEEGHR